MTSISWSRWSTSWSYYSTPPPPVRWPLAFGPQSLHFRDMKRSTYWLWQGNNRPHQKSNLHYWPNHHKLHLWRHMSKWVVCKNLWTFSRVGHLHDKPDLSVSTSHPHNFDSDDIGCSQSNPWIFALRLWASSSHLHHTERKVCSKTRRKYRQTSVQEVLFLALRLSSCV